MMDQVFVEVERRVDSSEARCEVEMRCKKRQVTMYGGHERQQMLYIRVGRKVSKPSVEAGECWAALEERETVVGVARVVRGQCDAKMTQHWK